jgi:hypothetical protein
MPLNHPSFISTPPDPLVAYWIGISPPDGAYVTPPEDEAAPPLDLATGETILVVGALLILGLPLLLGLIAWILLGL